MKKMTKKISAVLCSLTVMLSSATALMANAGNTSDTQWYSGHDYCRRKYDDTSVYVKNSSDYYYSYASVYGETTANGNQKKDVSRYGGTKLATENLTIPARSERQIRQFVYELGYPYVHIYFTGSGYGVWSPDSVGSYTLAN
ncbi:MAG: hypothetical protein K2H19_08020 [Ruminococcus sp.]|nr:hypothetical protein [Ruminococcus sp.]